MVLRAGGMGAPSCLSLSQATPQVACMSLHNDLALGPDSLIPALSMNYRQQFRNLGLWSANQPSHWEGAPHRAAEASGRGSGGCTAEGERPVWSASQTGAGRCLQEGSVRQHGGPAHKQVRTGEDLFGG